MLGTFLSLSLSGTVQPLQGASAVAYSNRSARVCVLSRATMKVLRFDDRFEIL